VLELEFHRRRVKTKPSLIYVQTLVRFLLIFPIVCHVIPGPKNVRKEHTQNLYDDLLYTMSVNVGKGICSQHQPFHYSKRYNRSIHVRLNFYYIVFLTTQTWFDLL
jgi:hypothetical protein